MLQIQNGQTSYIFLNWFHFLSAGNLHLLYGCFFWGGLFRSNFAALCSVVCLNVNFLHLFVCVFFSSVCRLTSFPDKFNLPRVANHEVFSASTTANFWAHCNFFPLLIFSGRGLSNSLLQSPPLLWVILGNFLSRLFILVGKTCQWYRDLLFGTNIFTALQSTMPTDGLPAFQIRYIYTWITTDYNSR